MVLPMIKVLSLVIKSASKPIAKQIKLHAARSPKFSKVVVKCANTWHSSEGKLSIFVGDKNKEPKPLNINASIDLGSELASEGFLLTIAVALLILENKRSSNKEKQKEDKMKERFADLENEIAKQHEEILTLKQFLLTQREKDLLGLNATLPTNGSDSPPTTTTTTATTTSTTSTINESSPVKSKNNENPTSSPA